MRPAALPSLHLLLALAVVAVWGTNFVVIEVGLEHLPPLLFAALRFLLAALPWVFLFKRPLVPWRDLVAYGILVGVGQFGLLYIALRADMSPALGAIVIQMQVFFTIGLATLVAGERIRPFQLAALMMAATGLALIVSQSDESATPKGLILVLCAALSWGASNLVVKSAGRVNMLAYVVWASLFAAPPLFILSFLLEGWPSISEGLRQAKGVTWLAVLWQTVGNTLFGFAAWGWLLARHPAATVTPVALLIPVFAMVSSALVLGEPMPLWKLAAATLVLAALAISLLWPLWKGHFET